MKLYKKIIATRVTIDLSEYSREAVLTLDYILPMLTSQPTGSMRSFFLKIVQDLSKKHSGLYQEFLQILKKLDQAGGADVISVIKHGEGDFLVMKSFIREFFSLIQDHDLICTQAILETEQIYLEIRDARAVSHVLDKNELVVKITSIHNSLRQEILLLAGYIYLHYGEGSSAPIVPFSRGFIGVKALEILSEALVRIQQSEDIDINRLFFNSVLARVEQHVNYLQFAKQLLIFSSWQKDASYVKLLTHLQYISPADLKLLAVLDEQSLGSSAGPDKVISTGMKLFFEAENKYYVVRLDGPHKGEEYYHVNVELLDTTWETYYSLPAFYVNDQADVNKLSYADLQILAKHSIQDTTPVFAELSEELQSAARHFPMPCWDRDPKLYLFFIEEIIRNLPVGAVLYDHHERDEKNIRVIIDQQLRGAVMWFAFSAYMPTGKVTAAARELVMNAAGYYCEQIADEISCQLLALEENDREFMIFAYKLLMNDR